MRRTAAVIVVTALLAAGCATGPADADAYEGLWQSEGFGLYLDISGSINVYEHTSVSCALVAAGSGRSSGEILGLADGRLVLAETDRTIWFDRIDALPEACDEPYRSDDPAAALRVVVASMDEHYAFFDLRGNGWEERVAAAEAAVTADLDDAGLLAVLQGLLGPLGDAQVRIAGPDRGVLPEGAWSAATPGPGLEALAEQIRSGMVPGLTQVEVTADRAVVSGFLTDGVGYLAINRLAGFAEDPGLEERALADALFSQLSRFAASPALVVDLRVNRGGREALAMLVASRFVAEDTPVATRTVRVGGTDRYVGNEDVVIRPLSSGPYPARLVVLTGPGTAGAGELLALALREVPGAALVGAPTAGSLSPMLIRELPNGWTLGLSNQRVLDADGVLREGAGVPVDVEIDEPVGPDADPVIEAALALIGG